MKNFKLFAIVATLFLTALAPGAWAENVNLSVDSEIAEGTAGHYYVNMPATGTNTLTLSDASVTTFKVYDDGGKNGKYSNNCSGYLVLTAPTGYALHLSGSIKTEKKWDYLIVYDGNTTKATKLLNQVSSTSNGTQTTITTVVVSSGQSMMLYFLSDDGWHYDGLDLTVTLVNPNAEFGITVNSATGGTVTASVNNQSVTSARIEDAVTLTATPESGYMLSGISVTDANSNAVDIDWSIWANTATFTMPGSAVTVTPTFTNAKTAADGLNINMPMTGTKTITIPAGVQSFHVDYDYKISSSVSSILVMTAPEGYLLQLSGTATMTGTDQAYFSVYDGDYVVSTPTLINSSYSNNYAGVVSTGNVMTIDCWTIHNWGKTWDLDITVNVVNTNTSSGVTISNSITNGQVVSDKNLANVNDIVTLTATPTEGYVLQSISVTDGNGAISLTPSATDATWGDASYYTANEFTFKMRSSDATVTATFMPKTDFYVNMPKTDQRDFTIPDGTTSFKVYDNSGKDGHYDTHDNGKLLLTAPEGYVMSVSGYVKLYYSSDDEDYLDIYDGNSTSATSLGRFKDKSGSNHTYTQTSVSAISRTNQMLLHFVTNDYGYVSAGGGVYLTVTLVPKEYTITYNGEEEATFATANPTTYTIESDAITLNNPSKTGYTFAGWTGTGLDAATISVTIAQGSTGDRSYTATWRKLLTNTDITIADIPNQTYTGSAICPEVVVKDGETVLELNTDYTVECFDNTNARTASMTITGAESYAGTVEKTFTITKAPLTVTAKNKTIAYGDEPANDGVEYSGLVNGETESVLGGELSYTYNYTKLDNAGTYTITPSGLTADNYEITFVGGTLTVEPKKLLASGAVQILEDENGTRAVIDGTYSGSEPVDIPSPVTVDDVVINRSFTPLKPATVVLPCELPEGTTANADFYQLADVSQKGCSWWADFDYIGEGVVPKANTPYAVVLHDSVSSGVLRFNLDGKKATCQTNNVDTTYVSDKTWYFVGVYSYKEWKEGNEELGLAYAFAGSDNEGGAAKGEFGKIKLKEGHTPHANPLRSYLRKKDSNVQLEASLCRAASVPGLSLAPAYSVQFIPEPDDVIEVEFVKRALVNGGANGGTTIIKGRYNTRTGEFKVLQTYDLKGRKLNGKPTAKGVYYGKKVPKK